MLAFYECENKMKTDKKKKKTKKTIHKNVITYAAATKSEIPSFQSHSRFAIIIRNKINRSNNALSIPEHPWQDSREGIQTIDFSLKGDYALCVLQ